MQIYTCVPYVYASINTCCTAKHTVSVSVLDLDNWKPLGSLQGCRPTLVTDSQLPESFVFMYFLRCLVLLHMCCITVTRWGGPGGIEAKSLNPFLQCFDTVGWVIWSVKTRPRYDLWCVWWDVKPYSTNQRRPAASRCRPMNVVYQDGARRARTSTMTG